jgi:hypothetical protein
MKKKENDTITTNKEADISDYACEKKKNPRPSYVSLSLSF